MEEDTDEVSYSEELSQLEDSEQNSFPLKVVMK